MTELPRLGRYRLLRRIAVGGVAEVYLAAAEGLAGFSKRVVVKRLYPEHARDAALVSMFLDEARLGALLHHPHIVEVYDIGSEGGDYFIAMEHVPGRDLRDLLDARPGEPLPLPAALAIVQAVAAGLHHAHEQRGDDGQLLNVVHRDVTPANVLLRWDGAIKLSDFGVAKWAAQRTRTEQGMLKGKLSYMSPEQARGQALDRRSDVFALGVLLYELTTGDRPFHAASDFEMLSAIVAGRYDAPSDGRPGYPAGLEAIVRRALETDPARRFADAAALGAALAAIAGELGAAGGAGEVSRCLHERFPGGEVTPEPVEVAAPVAADRTRTDAASSSAQAALAAPVPAVSAPVARPRSRVLMLAGLAVLVVAGSVLVMMATSSRPPAPPPTSRAAAPASPATATPASTGATSAPRQPAQDPVVSPSVAPVAAPATVRVGTAPAGSPVRRRPGSRHRPAEGQTVWDPDSPKLP